MLANTEVQPVSKIQFWHSLKYVGILFFPMIPIAAFLFESVPLLAWALPVVSYMLIPAAEQLLPQSIENLNKEEEEALKDSFFHKFILLFMLPVQWSLVALLVWELQFISLMELDARIIGLIFSVGICCVTFGINIGHELGHRNDRVSQLAAKGFLLSTLYMHFIIEHNRGHHRHVATEKDPASAVKGQWVYHFWFQSVVGSWKSAWNLEKTRIQKMELAWWKNEMIHFILIQTALVLGIYLGFGLSSMVGFCIAATIGFLSLETINYIEHYGLRRKLRENGKYERTQPHHSWNCNREIGRILLFELTRHSDHHAYPNRPYQILRHHDDAPELPAGYPAMFVLSLLPPLWFRVMDHRIPE